MSDTARIKNQIANLKAVRAEELSRADEETRRADELLRKAGSPPRPQDAYEHRKRCEAEASRLRSSATSARRHAESLLNEIRGLEKFLS
jgi:multidrug resistance efflux pump